MLRFRYAKANSHRFVSDLQTKAQAASSVIGTSIHLDSEVKNGLFSFPFSLARYIITCLTSWMRDSTRVFTFARGPVTPLTLTCGAWVK